MNNEKLSIFKRLSGIKSKGRYEEEDAFVEKQALDALKKLSDQQINSKVNSGRYDISEEPDEVTSYNAFKVPQPSKPRDSYTFILGDDPEKDLEPDEYSVKHDVLDDYFDKAVYGIRSAPYPSVQEPKPEEDVDEEIIINVNDLAEHYAMVELKEANPEFKIEDNTELYKEIFSKHLTIINNFKRNNYVDQ